MEQGVNFLAGLEQQLTIDNKRQISNFCEIEQGNIAVSSKDDGLINIYDENSGDLINRIKESDSKVSYLFKMSNNNLIICSFDGFIKIIKFTNEKKYEVKQILESNPEAKKFQTCLELSDGRLLSGDDQYIISWKIKPELKEYRKQKEIKLGEPVISLLSIDDFLIACATSFSHVFFFDVKHNIQKKKCINSSTCNNCLRKYNNRYLLSYGSKSLSVIDFKKMINLREIRILETIDFLYILPDKTLLLATQLDPKDAKNQGRKGYDFQQFKIDLEKYKIHKIANKNDIHDGEIVSIIQLKNGKFATSSHDYRIKVWG